MSNPVSIFIMDVSNSSKDDEFGQELTVYLKHIVECINEWTEGIVTTKVKHRMGDEILFISQNYTTAYTIAFYISRIWKYRENKPYFGLSFGDINIELENIDPDTWIHPLIKQARIANEIIKKESSNRTQFNFELDNIYDKNQETFDSQDKNYSFEFETLMNLLLKLQQTYINSQTELQELIFSLYIVFMQQKKIATLLGKSTATISSHFKKGNCEEIIVTFERIQKVLISLQKRNLSNEDNDPLLINKELHNKIKNNLIANIEQYFNV